MKGIYSIFFSAVLLFSIALMPGNSQEPTRWRGPEGNGIYHAQGLLDRWASGGPEVEWVYTGLGEGHSSAVAAGGHIYTTGMVGETGYLFKLDKTGSEIYKVAYGPEFTDSYYGTRGTPVVVGNRVYLVSGYGRVYCLNGNNGEKIWTVNMVETYGGQVIRWGYNETPVVDGDVIYCTPGGKTNNVMALNRHDGSKIWSCAGEGDLSAYCTPLLFNHNGRKILATHTASHLLGIDAKSGELLWSERQTNRWEVHANTPIYHDGELLYFSGYGSGSAKLTLDESGDNVKTAWKNSFDSRLGGAVLVDGYVYGSGDENSRDWQCINWETGKNEWYSSAIAKGNVIYADGKLYCYSERGELAMAKASPEAFNVASKTRVTAGTAQHWAHIMINNGILYLRHGDALVAYRVN